MLQVGDERRAWLSHFVPEEQRKTGRGQRKVKILNLLPRKRARVLVKRTNQEMIISITGIQPFNKKEEWTNEK